MTEPKKGTPAWRDQLLVQYGFREPIEVRQRRAESHAAALAAREKATADEIERQSSELAEQMKAELGLRLSTANWKKLAHWVLVHTAASVEEVLTDQ